MTGPKSCSTIPKLEQTDERLAQLVHAEITSVAEIRKQAYVRLR